MTSRNQCCAARVRGATKDHPMGMHRPSCPSRLDNLFWAPMLNHLRYRWLSHGTAPCLPAYVLAKRRVCIEHFERRIQEPILFALPPGHVPIAAPNRLSGGQTNCVENFLRDMSDLDNRITHGGPISPGAREQKPRYLCLYVAYQTAGQVGSEPKCQVAELSSSQLHIQS